MPFSVIRLFLCPFIPALFVTGGEGRYMKTVSYKDPYEPLPVVIQIEDDDEEGLEEKYVEFVERLSAYNMSQAEFIRQAITGVAIRPIIAVSPVNDELLAAVVKLTAEYGRIGGNLNQIARTLNEWHGPYPQLAGEVRAADT